MAAKVRPKLRSDAPVTTSSRVRSSCRLVLIPLAIGSSRRRCDWADLAPAKSGIHGKEAVSTKESHRLSSRASHALVITAVSATRLCGTPELMPDDARRVRHPLAYRPFAILWRAVRRCSAYPAPGQAFGVV